MSVRNRQVLMNWKSVVWCLNGFFVFMTVIYDHLPNNRQGIPKFLAIFSLQFEKNLATYWEGWCLLLVAVLAFERFSKGDRSEGQAWLGLSILTAGLSLDELGSIHERAKYVFSAWNLTGMSALVPIAVPVLIILVFVLYRMRHFPSVRCFWLTLAGTITLGSVVVQEYLEQRVAWAWWARGLRFGIEEGTELVGIFLLLCVVVRPKSSVDKAIFLANILPRTETFIRLRQNVAYLTLLGFGPLGILTVATVPVAENRGTPATWLPFVCLNLACMAAWTGAQHERRYNNRLLIVSAVALFFALDQIIVFERILDISIVRGRLANIMFPLMAGALLWIPDVWKRINLAIMSVLLILGMSHSLASEAALTFVIPLQALGVFWILTSALAESRDVIRLGQAEAFETEEGEVQQFRVTHG